MKIEVDRTHDLEGNLIFTIKVSNPHQTSFGHTEYSIMKLLEECKEKIYHSSSEDSKLKTEVTGLIHETKEKSFNRILDNLKFSIENDLRPKFRPICQEIYNWIYDYQEGDLKSWMMSFDLQRTKYFFDNDITPTLNNHLYPQASEHEDEEDGDDE